MNHRHWKPKAALLFGAAFILCNAGRCTADREYVPVIERMEDPAYDRTSAGRESSTASEATGCETEAGRPLVTTKALEESGQGQSPEGRIDLNTAGLEDLMMLKGIGQSRAEAIIAFRNEHGRFGSIEEIMLVPGIKEGIFNRIRDRIVVYPEP